MYAIVQKGYAIFGIGATRDEAIDDAREWLEEPFGDDIPNHTGVIGDMFCARCTQALADAVRNRGGAIAWSEKSDGILCLPVEEGVI